jgi:hypothetical protein
LLFFFMNERRGVWPRRFFTFVAWKLTSVAASEDCRLRRIVGSGWAEPQPSLQRSKREVAGEVRSARRLAFRELGNEDEIEIDRISHHASADTQITLGPGLPSEGSLTSDVGSGWRERKTEKSFRWIKAERPCTVQRRRDLCARWITAAQEHGAHHDCHDERYSHGPPLGAG